VTPKEAGAIELEEPDWSARFEEHCARWPRLPRYLQEDSAFDATLRDWRRFHFTWVEIEGKPRRNPAGATEAIIALAKLGIMPPRFLHKNVPREESGGYQADDHMWLSIRQEQWRIVAVEDRMLCLEKGFEDKPETMQINLATARWGKYILAAVELLDTLQDIKNPSREMPVTREG
jgi:hypothetical protein